MLDNSLNIVSLVSKCTLLTCTVHVLSIDMLRMGAFGPTLLCTSNQNEPQNYPINNIFKNTS